MARRGQYFTIDAFVALAVVATGLILVFAVNNYSPYSNPPKILSQEFVNTLAQTRIKEVNNPFVIQQVRGGNITNPDNTILQQAYEFKKYYNSNLSTWFISNVTQNLIPAQFNFEVVVDGKMMYSRGSGKATSNMLVSSKKIVFGVVNRTTEFWGPVIVEVNVWQ